MYSEEVPRYVQTETTHVKSPEGGKMTSNMYTFLEGVMMRFTMPSEPADRFSVFGRDSNLFYIDGWSVIATVSIWLRTD